MVCRGLGPGHFGFPAQAGVYPRTPSALRQYEGLPWFGICAVAFASVSPRRRGSTLLRMPRRIRGQGFPAQAGVYRGGLPQCHTTWTRLQKVSPRRRGSTSCLRDCFDRRTGFPAQAGVYRTAPDLNGRRLRFPRAGGGLPGGEAVCVEDLGVSPRRRGSTQVERAGEGPWLGFPAQAGVYRSPCACTATRRRFLRAGGGLPADGGYDVIEIVVSPRRRGSTRDCRQPAPQRAGFPAQAGVYLRSARRSDPHRGFPRAGGGLPARLVRAVGGRPVSPRRRGSTHGQGGCAPCSTGFPAQAGVYLLQLRT